MSEIKPTQILAKVAKQPAALVLKVTDWLLATAEDHWGEEVKLHASKMQEYGMDTAMGRAASEKHSYAFDQWHAIRVVRSHIPRSVATLGGREVVNLDAQRDAA